MTSQEPIGCLLSRLRIARGWSQLRLAELLCAVSGQPTVTRHEVSRWEREERIPSAYWLGWLAAVFDTSLDSFEAAAVAARQRRQSGTSAFADLAGLAQRVRTLRRMDDLVGGADLSVLVVRELRAALRVIGDNQVHHDDALPQLAELAQLTTWVAADAGAGVVALRAHRLGLRAARSAGDNVLAAHLLATAAHLCTRRDPRRALALARGARSTANRNGTPTTRSLLLHRLAYAAACAGQPTEAGRALVRAERLYDRRTPQGDPPWIYWFNETEFTAMMGRCYAAAGRPRLAEPLLRSSLDSRALRPRPWALYASWLAGCQLDLGEVDAACAVAGRSLIAAIRAGSLRAVDELRALHPRLLRHTGVAAVRDYRDLVTSARPYLPRCQAPPGAAGRGGDIITGPVTLASCM